VSDASSVRVLSYNVRHGQGVASLLSNARLARVISAINPAVAGLQEVWRVGSAYDQPVRLSQLTRMEGIYHLAHRSFAGHTGNLLLASGTVHSTEEIDIGGRREGRGCLVADIETAGIRFSFAVTHLSLHAQTRTTQMELLAERLPVDRPLVLVGDFNCLHRDLEPLSAVLTFSADTPKTFPSVFPMRALDHIGFSAHWELEKLVAVPSLASDHLPLVAELRLVG
jgi:endonuclease/exonuclease/phosphatase family metal-dependent hydrolase